MADISKITLPSGTTYDIKDSIARQAIAGGVSFIIAWDGASIPVAGNIPAGVSVTYGTTTTTGTLSTTDAQTGAFYFIKSSTTPSSQTLDIYDEYVVVKPDGSDSTTWFWQKIGDTKINLTDVVTGVTLNKQTDSVIGADSTFTITQPTIALATGATAGTGVISVATGITSVSASGDNVTALTGLGSPSTKSAIGASSTFTITQPTIALATDTTSGTGKVQVATGITSASASGDTVAAVTGYASPTSDTFLKGVKVTTQPTVTLTANNSTSTGRITYVESQGSATTTKLSASASGGAVSASGDNVTALTGLGSPSTKSAIGASSTFTITQPTITLASNGSSGTGRVQVATGGNTSSTTNTDWLKGVSVSNETLTIGAATPNTTYLGATASGANTAWNSKDAVTAVTGYANTTTDTVLGTASTFSVTNPSVTIASGSSGDVTVATGINSATTKYLSASASGTAVGANGTGSALTGLGTPTTDDVLGSSSTITVTPTTTYIKGTASGANTAWNNKDAVTAVTGYASPTTDTVLGTGSTITVTPTTTNIKATASGANTAWNNKDSVTVLTNSTTLTVTKGQ